METILDLLKRGDTHQATARMANDYGISNVAAERILKAISRSFIEPKLTIGMAPVAGGSGVSPAPAGDGSYVSVVYVHCQPRVSYHSDQASAYKAANEHHGGIDSLVAKVISKAETTTKIVPR